MKNIKQQAAPNSLRHFRKQRGLRQQDVAEVLDVKSRSVISKWENGHRIPHIANLVKLAVLYRTMVDAIYLDFRMEMKKEIRKKEQHLRNKKTTTENGRGAKE